MDIPPLYLDRIREYYPDLAASTARFNTDGLVNDVVIVGDERVFRFPKNAQAQEALAREIKLLDLVRRYVTLPVPIFEPHDGFVSYRLIPGRALHRNDILQLDEHLQDRLAEQVAVFLRQLHTLPTSALEQHRIPTSYAARTREDWIELFHDAERELYPLLITHSREWIARHFAPVLDGTLDLSCEPVLVHGDLGPYHLLYNSAAHQINGVIDFGAAGLGDPADDFANIINALGESFLKRMSKFYPEIAEALDRARFWAGTLELQWALNGLRSKDLSWLMVHIGRARDVRPMGTGWA